MLLTLNISDTLHKMWACRKHVNFTYIDILYIYINISNEQQVTICTLCVVNFIFLSVLFVGISYFLKIGVNNTEM